MPSDAPPKNGRSWKDRSVDIAWMSGLLIVISMLHTALVLPRTLEATRKIAREEMEIRMEQHESYTEERLATLHRRLDGLATREGLISVRDQLKSIDERLRHLERRRDGK